MPLISTLQRRRQAGVWEFKVSLVYPEFQESQGFIETPKREKD